MNVDTQRTKPITKNHVMRVRHCVGCGCGQLTSEAQTLTFAYMVPARDPQGGNGEGGKPAKRGFIMLFSFPTRS